MLLNGCAVHLHSFATGGTGKSDVPASAKRAQSGEEERSYLLNVALSFSININLCLDFLILQLPLSM